jgi:hypothetical protein
LDVLEIPRIDRHLDLLLFLLFYLRRIFLWVLEQVDLASLPVFRDRLGTRLEQIQCLSSAF